MIKPLRNSEKYAGGGGPIAETIMRKQICTSHFPVKISFQCLQSEHQKESCVSAHCPLLDLLGKTFSLQGYCAILQGYWVQDKANIVLHSVTFKL